MKPKTVVFLFVQLRREANEKVKKFLKDGLPEDSAKTAETTIQNITNDFSAKVEKAPRSERERNYDYLIYNYFIILFYESKIGCTLINCLLYCSF
jgi:hypothetical protein